MPLLDNLLHVLRCPLLMPLHCRRALCDLVSQEGSTVLVHLPELLGTPLMTIRGPLLHVLEPYLRRFQMLPLELVHIRTFGLQGVKEVALHSLAALREHLLAGTQRSVHLCLEPLSLRLEDSLQTCIRSFGLLLAFAGPGLVLAICAGRSREQLPLLACIVAYGASMILASVIGRYRLPAVPILAVFAGVAMRAQPTTVVRAGLGKVE